MKKFVDERKRQAGKHEQETALSLKLVREEEDALTDENKKVTYYIFNSLTLLII